MSAYIEIHTESRKVLQTLGRFDYLDLEGPPSPPPVPRDGYTYVLQTEPITWKGPTPAHELFLLDGQLVWQESMPLAVFKAQRSAEITAAKVAANADHFVYAGKKIAVDEASFREMLSTCAWVAMTQTMPANWPGGWKAMGDAGYVQFDTVPQWIDFYGTMVQTGMANFLKSQQLKAYIEDATTCEEVAALHW